MTGGYLGIYCSPMITVLNACIAHRGHGQAKSSALELMKRVLNLLTVYDIDGNRLESPEQKYSGCISIMSSKCTRSSSGTFGPKGSPKHC